jgi:hypothetical protein
VSDVNGGLVYEGGAGVCPHGSQDPSLHIEVICVLSAKRFITNRLFISARVHELLEMRPLVVHQSVHGFMSFSRCASSNSRSSESGSHHSVPFLLQSSSHLDLRIQGLEFGV